MGGLSSTQPQRSITLAHSPLSLHQQSPVGWLLCTLRWQPAIAIEAIPPDDHSLLDAILPRYQQGGCIAVVCNTVDESIAVARLLRRTEDIDTNDVWLFHARFPPVWRREIEESVLNAFGKDAGERPERAILRGANSAVSQHLIVYFSRMVKEGGTIEGKESHNSLTRVQLN